MVPSQSSWPTADVEASHLVRIACGKKYAAILPHVFSAAFRHPAAFDQTVRVYTFRTEHGAEVDFIVERGRELFAIEAKASRTVTAGDLRGLARFADYAGRKHRPMIWYLGREPKRINGVDVLPWQQRLEALGW